MATSPVAAALALPHVVAAVDSFNELLPGVAASAENLRPLLDSLIEKGERGENWNLEEPACRVSLHVAMSTLRSKKTKSMRVTVYGPFEPTDTEAARDVFRTWIDCKFFPVSVGGLAEALAWAKDLATRVRSGDFCPRCRRDGYTLRGDHRVEAPCKKLRARPLPMCEGCTLEMALGAPPEKRARVTGAE